jgi:hypothetical protein
MDVLVMSDTHIGPSKPSRRLPDGVYSLLAKADAVLHAGDVVAPALLHELEGFAPVHAVLGNNDVDLRLPERLGSPSAAPGSPWSTTAARRRAEPPGCGAGSPAPTSSCSAIPTSRATRSTRAGNST